MRELGIVPNIHDEPPFYEFWHLFHLKGCNANNLNKFIDAPIVYVYAELDYKAKQAIERERKYGKKH